MESKPDSEQDKKLMLVWKYSGASSFEYNFPGVCSNTELFEVGNNFHH